MTERDLAVLKRLQASALAECAPASCVSSEALINFRIGFYNGIKAAEQTLLAEIADRREIRE